jgi:hypothetical protein
MKRSKAIMMGVVNRVDSYNCNPIDYLIEPLVLTLNTAK